MRKFGTLI